MPDFDASKPSIARIYDYGLGGKDNFAVDRELAEKFIAMAPDTPQMLRENRDMQARAVRWAADQGVSQFLDLGCGLPTEPSTEQTALAAAPGARVAYVDNDPVVVNHLSALLRSDPAAVIVNQDVNDAEAVLAEVSGFIDRSRPVCLLVGALLHFFEAGAAREFVARYTAALAPGSLIILTIFVVSGPNKDRLIELYSTGAHPVHVHSEAEFASFFGNLELIPPGVADARTWRPGWETKPPSGAAREAWTYGGMARKTA